MGRGRAKAKQTKVARELKYHSPNTDLAALQRELSAAGRKPDGDFDDNDQYADDPDEDADDAQSWSSRSS
ncbi:MAG TPA: DUF3073 domain-containing protein [Micromonosporaceae bacterium]|nr:DUF3073 domain-containing protein [Micromonosporaceae bacterium]